MKQAIRIVHLEASAKDAKLIENAINELDLQLEVSRAKDRQEFERVLRKFSPDIVLSELSLPDIDAEEALKMMGTKSASVSFIIITAPVNEKVAAGMFRRGIDDYILKDRLQRLPSVIHRAVERVVAHRERGLHLELLRSRELRFRALVENSSETILLADANFNITYRSPAAARITGYTIEELEEVPITQRVHPDDRSSISEYFTRVLATTGRPLSHTVRVLHKHGHYMWINFTATNLLIDPHVKGIVLNYRDVTEMKLSELELVRTSKHFKALLENITDAILLLNPEGLILYQSPSVQRITGFPPHTLQFANIFNYVHSEDRETVLRYFYQQQEKPMPPEKRTCRMAHATGGFIWIEGTLTNMLHDESVRALVVSFHDITERKRSEKALRKSEANLKAIFENTNNAFLLIDRRFHVLSFNHLASERYLRELNIRLCEGLNIIDAMPLHRQEESRINFNRVLTGEKISYEISFKQENGELNWYDIDIVPVLDNLQNVIGIIISSEQITARKFVELERDKMTSDIVQHNKNLEQFAYIISHNLRSPVANIIGLTNLLSASVQLSEKDFNRCIDGLKLTARKLDSIITDLNFILQNRRMATETMESVNFSALVDDIRGLLSDMLAKEQIAIETDFGVQRIFTVRSYMHSIFLNLISNSVKYRNPAVATLISISSYRQDEKLILRFRDNGLGIDLQAHGDKLFGLYKKFHTHVEGKGMGLYMVKSQVEMLGGRISIDSQVNVGTEFLIQFGDPDH